MFRHVLELILGPAGEGMDVTILVPHELELTCIHGNGFGSDTQETAHVDDDLSAMQM